MKKSKKNIFLITGCFLVIGAYLIWHRGWFSPDQFYLVAFIVTLTIGRSKQFIHDWSVLTFILLGYEYFRGLAPKINPNVNIFPMVNFDSKIFSYIPTVKLQSLFFQTNIIHWYDYLAVILYVSHFIIPLLTAYIFWLIDKEYFKKYSIALLILSYAAFITYVIFPAMPPWMASNLGYIPTVHRVMDQIVSTFSTSVNLPTVYSFFGANLVAAVPSLHAAYPLLTFLFVFNKNKKIGTFLIPYVLGMWFSIIYLGEHYVFDLFMGILYATLVYLIIIINPIRLQFKKKFL